MQNFRNPDVSNVGAVIALINMDDVGGAFHGLRLLLAVWAAW